MLKTLRMLRALKVFRVVKTARYSKSITIISNVLNDSKEALMAVCTMAGAYILISALIIFNVEPDSFPTAMTADTAGRFRCLSDHQTAGM